MKPANREHAKPSAPSGRRIASPVMPAAGGTDARGLVARVRMAFVALAWTIALGGAVVGSAIAVPALVARADTARPASRIEVRFEDAPAWMSPQDLAPLEELVRDQLSGRPFDQDGLRIAADGLRASGWFDSIAQVRRTSLSTVDVTASWVEPTALVRDSAGDHLIDAQGRRLPRSYLPSAAPAFPSIVGSSSTLPPAPGQRYLGGDIAAALALLRALEDRPFRGQISAIDTSRYHTEGTLVLITGRDARLLWGHAPGEVSAAEVPTHQKLAYLQFLYEHYGRIDAFSDGELDLTRDHVFSRR